jgi:hypothetical protein
VGDSVHRVESGEWRVESGAFSEGFGVEDGGLNVEG